MKSLFGVYRAVCLGVDTEAGVVRCQVPQIFAGETVTCLDITGGLPEAGDVGWVAFESGFPDRPVWLSAGGGGGGDEVFAVGVKAYGAVGDDVADDTAAIQAAINDAGEGNTVYFPPGKYRTTSPLYVPRGVTLRGQSAPRWSYTFPPQAYIKIRSTFSGAACIHLRDKAQSGASVDNGNIRIIDLCLDGSAYTATAVDGILASGLVRDVRIQNVSCRNFSGVGVHTTGYTRTDTVTYYPRGWELSHVVGDTCANQGFAFNLLNDSILLDCLAVGNTTQGFYLAGSGENQVIGCRAVWNKNYGFWVTGLTYGSTVFSACTTDRNEAHGIFVDATGKLPILFSGCSLRRDGRQNKSGGNQQAGFRASGATVPIVISGLNVMPGQDDDFTGVMSPDYGLRVNGCTAVQVHNGYLHGFVGGLLDGGTNTNFYMSNAVTLVSGSATSPTITHFASA